MLSMVFVSLYVEFWQKHNRMLYYFNKTDHTNNMTGKYVVLFQTQTLFITIWFALNSVPGISAVQLIQTEVFKQNFTFVVFYFIYCTDINLLQYPEMLHFWDSE
jgi:hypothetical protein